MKISCVSPGFHLHLLDLISFYPSLPLPPLFFPPSFLLSIFLFYPWCSTGIHMVYSVVYHADAMCEVCVCRHSDMAKHFFVLCSLKTPERFWSWLNSTITPRCRVQTLLEQILCHRDFESLLSCLFLLCLGRCVSILQLPSHKHALFVWLQKRNYVTQWEWIFRKWKCIYLCFFPPGLWLQVVGSFDSG